MVTLDYLEDTMNMRVLWSCALKEFGVVCVTIRGITKELKLPAETWASLL